MFAHSQDVTIVVAEDDPDDRLLAEEALEQAGITNTVEWVKDGVNGRVVPPRDAPALTRAINEYLENPALRARCGAAALELARSRAGLDGNLWRAEQVYRWLVEGRMLHESVRGIAMQDTAR